MRNAKRTMSEHRSTQRMIFIVWAGITFYFIINIIYQQQRHQEIKQLIEESRDLKDTQIDSLQAELDTLHTLSWENIEYWIDTLGIQHKEVVLQQIALETGNLTSDICFENNNLFGMKEPRIRETTAIGTNRGHAMYPTYIDSIKDYFLYQQNMYDGGDYYAFLKRIGYATAPNYTLYLKRL